MMHSFARLLACLWLYLTLASCGYNDFQILDEKAKSAWTDVLSQYQRRADLIPNVVATVQSEAGFEKGVLTQVVEARAKVVALRSTPETANDPPALQRFDSAQSDLSTALSRLLVDSANDPRLKSNLVLQDLRVQLEGTENRIAVARDRYIKVVQEYNTLARSFPSKLTAMTLGYKPKGSFTVANESTIIAPPKVDFGASR